MGWTNLQSADDAARSLLRYRCRYRPGLKLMGPESCEAYKTRQNPMTQGGTDALLCLQWQCQGPVEIEVEPLKKENMVVAAKKDRTPKPCRTCGLRPGDERVDGSVAEFWPSRPHECINCTVDRRTVKKGKPLEDQAKYLAVQEETIRRLKGEESPKAPKYKYTCEIHGPHNGWQVGLSHSKGCPQCAESRRVRGLKAYGEVVAGVKGLFEAKPWIDAWLKEEAADRGVENRFELLADIVADKIPAEWFKRRAMGGGKEGSCHK